MNSKILFIFLIILVFNKNLWNKFYGKYVYEITGSINDPNWTTMNYGYSPSNINKNEKYSLMLYKKFVSPYIFHSSKVLEISSGRGGGLNYLAKQYPNSTFLGIDFSKTNIESSKKNILTKNINYIEGNALELNLKEKYDVIINIEASHCYNNYTKFYKNINNILNKNGTFIYLDFIKNDEHKLLEKDINKYFNIVKYNDITNNVVQSLINDNIRKKKLIDTNIKYNILFRYIAYHLYGLKDSIVFNRFKTKYFTYFAYILKKNKI